MRSIAVLAALAALADSSVSVPAQMRLKDGTVYELKEPPHLSGARFVFKTRDGKVYSLAESEVEEIRLVGPTPVPRVVPNPQDSHQLGAIARQERHRKGTHTLIAPAATPRPSRKSSR
jgi:hypothetical protein